MDPIELEAMLNSDNKEERIRARRLVRPRVNTRDPFPIAFPFCDPRVHRRSMHPSIHPRVIASSLLPSPPPDAPSPAPFLRPRDTRFQRIAARVAARERERSEREHDEAMAAFAEQERSDAAAATPGKPGHRRDGSRPVSAQVAPSSSRPGSASKPKHAAAADAGKRSGMDAKTESVGAGELLEKNSARSVVAAARDELLRADREASYDVSGVRAEADAREYRRRRDDQSRRAHIRDLVKEESLRSRSAETEIERGWEEIRNFAKDEPLALRDALASLKAKCDAAVRSKDDAASYIAAELDRREEAYAESLRRQNDDVDELLRRMRLRAKEQMVRARRALETVESDLEARRRSLLEKNDAEMRAFFEKRESAERAYAERTAANAQKYADELEKRRADDAEEFGILKTRLETDVANLEQHLAKMRAVYQLNAEKLEYNYRVLVEREAENQSTSSQQRKKIAFAREKLMVLKQKHAEAEKKFAAENVKLAEEHRRAAETFKELQMKHKRFVRADTKKFEEVWAMHEELVAAKVKRVLDADRVIHEQQLGWRWRPPSDDVFLKPDDLALVEGRKKREAAAAAAAAAAAEAVADESQFDDDDGSEAPLRPEADPNANPSIADSEENPFVKRLCDPAYAELLEVTAEACFFLVDPATSRALADAEARARDAGDAADAAATAAAAAQLRAESVLRALGVRDAPSFDALVAAMTMNESGVKKDDLEETQRRSRKKSGGGVFAKDEALLSTETLSRSARRSASAAALDAIFVPDYDDVVPRLIAFAESEKGASAGGRALAALKAANAVSASADDTSGERKEEEDKPKPRKTRAELEAAFWQRQANVVGAKPTRAWSALERGLEKYVATLTKRKDAMEQTASLAKQNEELRGLLRQYLGADVNDELIVPPSALL
jgi:dynein regulatory complex protein 1